MLDLNCLYNFLQNSQHEPLTEDVISATKRAFIDTLAVTIAGSQVSPLPEITRDLAYDGGQCTIIGKGTGFNPQVAAFYNSTAAHVLDMDDCDPYMGHPSAVLVPTLLALGEDGNVSGENIVKAYASSYFAAHALGERCCYDISSHGWHATSVIMTVAAAWCGGMVCGFNAKQFADATSVAASFASGVRGNFGTPVKPIHAGISAQNGVLIAKLVEKGVYGSPLAVTGAEGYFKLFAGLDWNPKENNLLENTLKSTNPLLISPQTMKLYPSCSSNHQAVFAFLDIFKEHPELSAENVKSINVYLNKWALGELVTPQPKTGVQARFSPGFHFALTLQRLPIVPTSFTDDVVNYQKTQEIIAKTKLYCEPSYNERFPWPARVVIQTTNGESFEKIRDEIDGGQKFPLTDQQINEKFLLCTTPVLGEKSKQLLEKLLVMEKLESIGELSKFLS